MIADACCFEAAAFRFCLSLLPDRLRIAVRRQDRALGDAARRVKPGLLEDRVHLPGSAHSLIDVLHHARGGVSHEARDETGVNALFEEVCREVAAKIVEQDAAINSGPSQGVECPAGRRGRGQRVGRDGLDKRDFVVTGRGLAFGRNMTRPF